MSATDIYVHQCPDCPWYRVRPYKDRLWDSQKIWHPLYGRVPNRKVYELDIENHRCAATREVRIKYGFDPEREYNGKNRNNAD